MDQIKIGKFIAELRKGKKIYHAELCAKLGVTNKTISRWENGNYMPELINGERLDNELYRQYADNNITASLEQQEQLKHKKSITNFLQGDGTGILVSTLYSPDSIHRTTIIIIGILMILIGWYRDGFFS